MTRLGVECVVCVPDHKETVALLGTPLFEVVVADDLRQDETKRSFDLIHVWTPREVTRKIALELLALYPCPYIVHLEDNEEFIIESYAGFPIGFLKHIPNILLDLLIPETISHPLRYKEFLEKASGVTVIMETLKDFCPPNIPSRVIWAGYQEDLEWDMSQNAEYKRRLGIARDEFVVAYTGNVHAANQEEVASLYEAIDILNHRGVPVKLIRTGEDHVRLSNKKLDEIKKKYGVELGLISRADMPSLLSITDALVQPGKPGRFNDYRFPSKLPEYLASGKPVVLPKSNIGHYLKNNEECLLLDRGDALDIAEKLSLLFSNESLRNAIGSGGRQFAEKHLRWSHIADSLHSFYISLLNDVKSK
ncbi:MAG: glycosyltransferase [Anaerolineales bacterium]|nr:glycosyltransferase [Anaerolineales bacterium]